MAATETIVSASRLPGPPELLPGCPDAIVDLQTDEGAALVGARWRYADAEVREIDFVAVGSPADPLGLGLTGGEVVEGFNAPNRVVLTRDARPGQRFAIAVFGINGPISVSPHNYIWMRTATLDFYAPERASFAEPAELRVERSSPD